VAGDRREGPERRGLRGAAAAASRQQQGGPGQEGPGPPGLEHSVVPGRVIDLASNALRGKGVQSFVSAKRIAEALDRGQAPHPGSGSGRHKTHCLFWLSAVRPMRLAA
jgi:hypothetical protein